jgi:NAD-dependent dihydropyrimidine dehydrogenase PreA subunit
MHDHDGDPHWRLAHRYGKAPLSSPVNELLVQMLRAVFSEEEAALVACFPLTSATGAQLARRSGLPPARTEELLQAMDRRGSILAYQGRGPHRYALLPILPGLFELFMCSGVDDPRRRSFAEAFEAYYDDRYYPRVLPQGVVTIIPVEKHIAEQPGVLPSDSVGQLIDAHDEFALAVCSCRHSRELAGGSCGLPKDVCMVFGPLARFVIQRKLARSVTRAEMHDAARRAEEAGLVHLADNVEKANFLCSCCACCCAGLRTLTQMNRPDIVASSRFLAEVDHERCNDCGKCARRCPTAALRVFKKQLLFTAHRCIGCGLCVSACKKVEALSLRPRPDHPGRRKSWMHFGAELGLQSFGIHRLLGGPLAGAYRSMTRGLGDVLERQPLSLSQIDESDD